MMPRLTLLDASALAGVIALMTAMGFLALKFL